MKSLFRLLLIFSVAATHFSEAQTAYPGSDEKPTAPPEMEEIVVRATKMRAGEVAQDVPIAISALGAAELDSRKIVLLQDLGFALPNVALDDIGSVPGIQNFTIRGLGINSSIPSIDPAVGVFTDGVYLGVSYGTNLDTFNLESVEILRGPQGVLFGRNVTGGAVLVRTRRPDGANRVRGKIGVENGPKWTVAGSIEGSLLGDKLFGLLTVYGKDNRGSIPNTTWNRDVGEMETFFARPTFVYRPTDDLHVDLILEHGTNKGDGYVPQAALSQDPLDISDNVSTRHNYIGYSDQTWNQATVETVYNLNANSTITNTLGWRELDADTAGDADASPLDLFNLGIFFKQHQVSDELRYNWTSGAWDTAFGVYYFEQSFTTRERRSLLGSLRAGVPIEVAGGGDQDHTTWGVFANADFRVTESVTLTGGVRRTGENKDVSIYTLGTCDFESTSCGNAVPILKDMHTWSNWSPKVGASWKPSDNLMLYASWTKGYRSGGYNLRVTSPSAFPGPTDDEAVSAYEIGFKSQSAGGRFRFNVATFFNELSDLQREVNTSDPVLGIVQGIFNTADGDIFGSEVESTVLLTDKLWLDWSVGYLDFEYTDVRFDLTGDGVVNGKDKSLMLPRLAKWSYNVGLGFRELMVGPGKYMDARVDYGYRDEAPYTDNNLGMLPAVSMLDAKVAVDFENTNYRFRISLYGKNLLDEVVLGSNAPLPWAALGAPRTSALAEGRRYGIEVQLDL